MARDSTLQDVIDSLRTQLATAQAEVELLRAAITMWRRERDKLQSEVERLKKECSDNQDWINSLCKDICKMEDALGFANDQHDKSGAFVPTLGPWLERVRDLIAAEGELGDVKADLTKRDEQLSGITGQLNEATWIVKNASIQTKEWISRRDAFVTAIHSCLGTTEGGEK